MKDTVVSGSLRATDTLYSTTAQFNILRAPTASNGTTYGPGTANNLLKSNGNSIYWTTLAASDIPTISITDKTNGILTVARGGTGATIAANARANLNTLYTAHLSNANLDDIVYNFLGTVWNFTGTGVSAFSSKYGTLICTDINPFGTNGSRLQQFFINFFDNEMWIRNRIETTWSEWTCLRQANGVVPILAGGTGATTAANARANLEITPANIGALPNTTTFVSGVKGNAESSYRNGNVNLTPTNIGAIAKNETGNTQQLVRPAGLNGVNDITYQTLINDVRANRLAFLPADQIIIEKTIDGGATWTDAGYTDAQKQGLFSEKRQSISIPQINSEMNTQCGLRVTVTGMKYNVPANTNETQKYNYWNSNYVVSTERYCQIKNMYFWVSAAYNSIKVKVERATGAASTNWVVAFDKDDYGMTGWSGSDIISFPQDKFGGGITNTGNFWNWRFTFMTRGPKGSTTLDERSLNSVQQIFEIRGYGDTYWTKSNEYMASDHLYGWDYSQNAIFPADILPKANNTKKLGSSSYKWANVYATTFTGNLTGNVTGNVSGTSANVTGIVAIEHGGTGQTSIANIQAGKDGDGNTISSTYLKLSGGTMTDTLIAPIIQTGDNDSNYFQAKKFRGQGDANSYYHAIDFGCTGHDRMDFYEYGGIFCFHKHTGAAIGSGDTIIGTITSNGWEGNVIGTATSSSKLILQQANVASTSTDTYTTDGLNIRWFDKADKLPGQPSQYGFLLTLGTLDNGAENHQIFAAQVDGSLYHRGTNSNSYTNPPAFKTILDSNNYTNWTVAKSGDTMTGNLTVQHSNEPEVRLIHTTTGVGVYLDNKLNGNHGIWSTGYWDGSSFVSSGKWLIYRNSDGTTIVNGNAANVTGTIGVPHGGTGAATAADARTNLGITPANIGAVAKSGDTMTGSLTVQSNTITLCDTSKGNLTLYMYMTNSSGHGIYTNGYYNGSNFVDSGRWLVYRDAQGITRLGNTVRIDNGGTGATTAADARANLEITPANIGAVAKSGDTMTGLLTISHSNTRTTYNDGTRDVLWVGKSTATNAYLGMHSLGYYNADGTWTADAAYIVYREPGGNIRLNGRANSLPDRTLTIGSTGKTFNGTGNVSWSLAEIGAVKDGGVTSTANLNENSIRYLNTDSSNSGVQYGALFTMEKSDGSRRSQLFIQSSSTNADTFVRTYINTWQSWHRVYTDATTIPIPNGGTNATTPAQARTNLGINSSFYRCKGYILTSPEDSTIKGYGHAIVAVINQMVIINFDAEITNTSTVNNKYSFGIHISNLKTLNSSVPNIQPSTTIDGLINYYTASGALNLDLQEYAGTAVGTETTTSLGWAFGRIYNTTEGKYGTWAHNQYSSGMHITGTLYGTLA